MLRSCAFRLLSLLLLTSMAGAFPLFGGGGVDPSFQNLLPATVGSFAARPDGKVIVGAGWYGNLTDALLRSDGSRDLRYDYKLNRESGVMTTTTTLLSPAGWSFMAGRSRGSYFGVFNGPFKALENGTLDPGFSLKLLLTGSGRDIQCSALQSDGRLLIGGDFYFQADDPYFEGLHGPARHLARVRGDGSPDLTLNVTIDGTVRCVAIQLDGRIIIGGDFLTVNGAPRHHLARLNPNGSVDASFNPDVDGPVYALGLDASNRVLVGGDFTSVNGLMLGGLVRLSAAGMPDVTFAPFARQVTSLAIQSDGRIIIACMGNRAGLPVNGVLRVRTDGTLDSTFSTPGVFLDTVLNPDLHQVTLAQDGRVYVADASGGASSGLVRLLNDPATETLQAVSSTTVRWLRGGTSPELQSVSIELSQDGGASFTSLGAARRITGGWELAGLSLPAKGQLRATGISANGNGSMAARKAIAYGRAAAPNVLAEMTDGTPVTTGMTVDIGVTNPTVEITMPLNIRNGGESSLSGISVTVDDTESVFSILQPDASIPGAGAISTFIIRGLPTSIGIKTGTVHIASNDPDTPVLDIPITLTVVNSTDAALEQFDAFLADGETSAINESFDPELLSYTAGVPYQQFEIAFAVQAHSSLSTVYVNGVLLDDYDEDIVPLPLIGDNIIDVRVVAQDGVTERIYELVVNRASPYAGETTPNMSTSTISSPGLVAEGPDGRTWIVGTVNSNLGSFAGVTRLNTDQSVDDRFRYQPTSVSLPGSLRCMAVLNDGSALIAGDALVRVLDSGVVDPDYDVGVSYGEGPGSVEAISMQPDGRAVVGGSFWNIGGSSRSSLARLNLDGSVDSTFNAPVNGSVYCAAVQSNGDIVIGGDFNMVGTLNQSWLARVHSDGTPDNGFTPGADGAVTSIRIDAAGNIIIAGAFSTINGTSRNGVARLSSSGGLQGSFVATTTDVSFPSKLALQIDGNVLFARQPWATLSETSPRPIHRLLTNGSVDLGFQPPTDTDIPQSMLLRSDGSIFGVDDLGNSYRLNNSAAAHVLSVVNPTRVDWMRSGAGCEADQVWFELWTNHGATRTNLGNAARVAGGWRLTGLSLPPSGQLHAVARVNADGGHSSSLIEDVIPFGRAAEPDVVVTHQGIARVSDSELLIDPQNSFETLRLDFDVRNAGEAPLTVTSAYIDGSEGSESFHLAEAPSAPIDGPRGRAPLAVIVDGCPVGVRTATLHIETNDPDQPIFDVPIRLNVVPSTDANLVNISADPWADLSPSFSSDQFDYSFTVPAAQTDLRLFIFASQPMADIEVNSVAASSGTPTDFMPLSTGHNLFTITVTALDGITTQVYTVDVYRPFLVSLSDDFAPAADDTVHGCVELINGKLLVYGAFTMMNGVPASGLAMLASDGSLDSSFTPPTGGGTVRCATMQPDGKVIVGGGTFLGATTHANLTRLNGDGSIDETFTASLNNTPNAVALQPDGKVVVVGPFTQANATSVNGIARFNADGTLDPMIDIFSGSTALNSVALDSSGRVFVAGSLSVSSSPATAVRLLTTGVRDPGFALLRGSRAECVVMTQDGDMLVGGNSLTDSSVTGNLLKLSPSGSASYFNFNAAALVRGVTLVEQEGALVAGSSSVSSPSEHHLTRINAYGATDYDLDRIADNTIFGSTVLPGGNIVAFGRFTTFEGAPRDRIAMLKNQSAMNTLSVPDLTQVQWDRSGPGPEITQVQFELSTDHGLTYSPLGTAQRTGGGWQVTGLSLPASGQIRAWGLARCGTASGSEQLVRSVIAFGAPAPAPAMIVEQPMGTTRSSGATAEFGTLNPKSPATLRFRLRNTGESRLTGIALTIDGTHPNDFSIIDDAQSSLEAGGDSCTFAVQCDPLATGSRSAVLHIASNAPGGTFDVNLHATGALSSNAGLASLSASPYSIASPEASSTTRFDFPFDVVSVVVSPVASQGGASILVNGTPVVSGGSATVGLAVGSNTVTVHVTSQDDGTSRNYFLDLERAAASTAGEVSRNGSLDVSGIVNTSLTAASGQTYIGGSFSSIDGSLHYRLARLRSDGTLDASYNPNLGPPSSGRVNCMALQRDGKLIVGGSFDTVNGRDQSNLARLNPDGTLDDSFVPPFLDAAVNAIIIELDGSVVVGGGFVAGSPANKIIRLNADGSLASSTFAAITPTVTCISQMPDGSLLVGGFRSLQHLLIDGSLDSGFNVSVNGTVNCAIAAVGGGIIIGGRFSTVGGQSRAGIARINSDGSVDVSYSAALGYSTPSAISVNSIAQQSDGKLILGGTFNTVGAISRPFVARIDNTDGLDTSFFAPATAAVNGVTLGNGVVDVAGSFDGVSGESTPRFARLDAGAFTDQLTVNAPGIIHWERTGACPEPIAVYFETSDDDGSTWQSMGAGHRVTGAWEATNSHIPSAGLIRGSAKVQSGLQNGSYSFIEIPERPFSAGTPEIRLSIKDGPSIDENDNIDFGPYFSQSDQTIVVSNDGTGALTNFVLTIGGANASDFTVVTNPAASVAAGSSTEIKIRFHPGASGERSATLQLASNDLDEPVIHLTLSGRTPVIANPAETRWSSKLVVQGAPFELAAPYQVLLHPFTVTWKKNGKVIPGAGGLVLRIKSPTFLDAAEYSFTIATDGGQVSDTRWVGVIGTAPSTLTLKPGDTARFKCQVVTPPGFTTQLEWMKNDVRLPLSNAHYDQSVTPFLSIPSLVNSDAAYYACFVTMTHPVNGQGTGRGPSTELYVKHIPAVDELILPRTYVGQTVRVLVPTINNPTRLTATGLPPGITMSSAGVISGKPTAALIGSDGLPASYLVSITAINAEGQSTSAPLPWTILPIQETAIGTFDGLVERRAPLNKGFGGRFTITTTSMGTYTGTLTLGATVVILNGKLETPIDGQQPGGTFKINRNAPDSRFTIFVGANLLTGFIQDGVSGPCSFYARRNTWSAASPAPAGYVGNFNSALEPPADVALPQGDGYCMTNVSSTGAVTWTGRLADNTVITGKTTLGAQGQIARHQMLYANTGSVQGWTAIDKTTRNEDGTLDWLKLAQPSSSTTRSYKKGFLLHDLTVIGAAYVPPASGQVVLGLSPPPPDNAGITFTDAGLASSVNQSLQITTSNLVIMPASNPHQIRLTINASTGLFSGNITFFDNDPLDVAPPIRVLTRNASYYGVIVTRSRFNAGVGFFNLAVLPAGPGQTVLTTPVLSGFVGLSDIP